VRIELDSLEGKEARFAYAYDDREFALDDERVRLAQPPEIRGRLIRVGNQVLLKGRLSARAQVDCDRCLKPVEVQVATEFSLPYVTAEDYESIHAAELEEADMALSVFDGAAIDIDDVVREQVLLAMPERALCREDCKGLCLVCGSDRNLQECDCEPKQIDPRLAVLKDLR